MKGILRIAFKLLINDKGTPAALPDRYCKFNLKQGRL